MQHQGEFRARIKGPYQTKGFPLFKKPLIIYEVKLSFIQENHSPLYYGKQIYDFNIKDAPTRQKFKNQLINKLEDKLAHGLEIQEGQPPIPRKDLKLNISYDEEK
jgi:hypothetical protein